MDPKLVYWTAAMANFFVLAVVARLGWLQAKQGDITAHKRSMVISICLVLGFLVSYGLKLAFLGREDMMVWSDASVRVALRRALQLKPTRIVTGNDADPSPDADVLTKHRRAGRVALIAMAAGAATAAVVLAGMYSRH